MRSRHALIFGSASQTVVCHLKDAGSIPTKTPQRINLKCETVALPLDNVSGGRSRSLSGNLILQRVLTPSSTVHKPLLDRRWVALKPHPEHCPRRGPDCRPIANMVPITFSSSNSGLGEDNHSQRARKELLCRLVHPWSRSSLRCRSLWIPVGGWWMSSKKWDRSADNTRC